MFLLFLLLEQHQELEVLLYLVGVEHHPSLGLSRFSTTEGDFPYKPLTIVVILQFLGLDAVFQCLSRPPRWLNFSCLQPFMRVLFDTPFCSSSRRVPMKYPAAMSASSLVEVGSVEVAPTLSSGLSVAFEASVNLCAAQTMQINSHR